MTICSTAPAARPQGSGQCGTSRPDVDQRLALLGAAQRADPLRLGADLGPDGLCLGWQVQRDLARVPRAACAVTSSASSGEPSTALSARARRKNRWASCSQVKPMPPCTWMFICALCTAGAKARCAAMAADEVELVERVGRRRRAASQTAAVASSAATSMSAQWCLTAWKVPIVRPNCTRSFA